MPSLWFDYCHANRICKRSAWVVAKRSIKMDEEAIMRKRITTSLSQESRIEIPELNRRYNLYPTYPNAARVFERNLNAESHIQTM